MKHVGGLLFIDSIKERRIPKLDSKDNDYMTCSSRESQNRSKFLISG